MSAIVNDKLKHIDTPSPAKVNSLFDCLFPNPRPYHQRGILTEDRALNS